MNWKQLQGNGISGKAMNKKYVVYYVIESYFLPLDKDLGSDYYLKLTGTASKMLKKEIPFSATKP